ncbi:MAG: PP2C family protein-serine/threonine phosphatase [Blastocatellales bacterium]
MRLLVSLSGDGERLTGMTIEETPTAEMRDRMNARRGGTVQMLLRAGSLIFLPLGILITIFYISGLARRQIDHATTLIFFLTAFILTFGSNLFSEFADDLILSTQLMGRSPTGWAAQILPRLLFLLINLLFAFGAYATWAASMALSLRVREKLMLSLELLLKGRFLTVPVAGGFVSGIAFAGLLAALPYLVISTGLFRGAVVASTDAHTVLAAQAPWLAGLVAGYEFEALVIFAFTGSLIYGMIRRRAVARALLALIAFAAMVNFARIDYSAPAVIITGILATALLLYLYNWFGILSVLTAVIATQYIANGAALLVQSSDSLLRSGWTMIVFTALAFIAGLVALSRSREATPEELAVPEHLVSGRIERERLKAEFDVARKAQQKMLPDSEPRIEGLDIAAICQPSKEVGGDLFDFLRLKDGRLGIVVADVSGKGVPASLYMTLTKGLLDSVSEIETDPGMILREVNRHLYEVCQRRVFVTLFLGILDPVTGHFEFARAGHNPPVLHRPHDKTTLMLKPRGMGLGLNSGRIFDQSIQVDSTDLNPGDILLIYSDGITEAMNHRKEEFGEDRLQDLAGRLDGLDARGIKTRVFDEVSRFLGNIPPQDDQTLVVVKRI